MAIEVLNGNAVTELLKLENATLIHVTNAQATMGSGIALEIKNRVADAYDVYMQEAQFLGQTTMGFERSNTVINMTAQEFYGSNRNHKYLNYGALASCLTQVSEETFPGSVIILPYLMGCDRAGGDWAVVSEMVEFILGGFDVRCYKL